MSGQATAPPIVAGIGGSAGGIQALQTFFDAMPADLGVAFVVVVHLSPEHRSELATILRSHTSMRVEQVTHPVPLVANRVYVIPPDRGLKISDSEVSAVPFDVPRGRRAPIDLLFRSLADHHADSFAVVLSGGGTDGAIGVRAIKAAGGLVLVQDPEEAPHDSMPRAAIATGVADVVLPVRELAGRLADLTHSKHRIRNVLGDLSPAKLDGDGEASLGRILTHLHTKTGHDFSKYKRSTVLRRISRRMQVHRTDTLADYHAFLRRNAEEGQALFGDLLISVTTFFRDPEAWDALATRVVAPLIANAGPGGTIRIWVPGCASGEEAYSLAILFQEEMQRREVRPDLQIFASDLDETALAAARAGCYPESIAADVPEDRLHRFFRRDGDRYCVVKELRDCVLFAAHSLLRDPPFSRLDLVSCRNVLIYLDRELQEQVFGVFRYALKPGRFLFLGASETAEGRYFREVDKKHHLFEAKEIRTDELPHLPELLLSTPRGPAPGRPASDGDAPAALSTDHRRALEDVGPPSILVDEQRSAIHLSETAGRFLNPPGGPLTRDITRLVRPELQLELRAALFRAFDRGEGSLSSFIPVRFNGTPERVALLVRPRPTGKGERAVLVVFVEGGPATADTLAEESDASAGAARQLAEELRQTQDHLRSSREEFDASTEELRSANEELQSINEEYRSTAEELETSKEELQSINEELETVNAELKVKLDEVSRAHSDLENLMAASEVGTLFLDRSLRIARFTPPVTELFNIVESDRGRPITDFTHHLSYTQLTADAREVLEHLVPVEREVRRTDGRWYLARIRPYVTVDDRIDGVVVTFVDFTARREAEEALRQSEERYRLLVEGVSEYAIFMIDPGGRVATWNSGAKKMFGYDEGEIVGRQADVLLTPEDGRGGTLDQELEVAVRDGTAHHDRWQVRNDGTRFSASGVTTALRNQDGGLRGFAEVLRDNTERDAAETARVHFRSLFESAPGLYLVLKPENEEIVAASDAYLAATNTRREDIVGRTLFEVLPADPTDPKANGVKNLRTSLERVKRERRADVMAVQRYPVRGSNGGALEERWWSGLNSPVAGPDGELAYIIHRVEDVTPFVRQMREQRREAEGHRLLESRAQHMEADVLLRAQELLRANEQLRGLNELLAERAKERERLLESAQKARELAEGANRTKNTFMATLSHELRTPLNAIMGYADLLDAGAPAPLPPTAKAHVDRIRLAAQHLRHLIGEVLDFSRIEAGRDRAEVARVDLSPLLDEVSAIAEPLASARGLAFRLVVADGAPSQLVTDPAKLRQVLLNLIGNAIKFTRQGHIELIIRRAGAGTEFEVRDTGIGISPENVSRVFEPFWQADSALTRSAGGSGLGLAIVQRYVLLLGGQIRVESGVGKGSAFVVSLPG